MKATAWIQEPMMIFIKIKGLAFTYLNSFKYINLYVVVLVTCSGHECNFLLYRDTCFGLF